MKKNCKAAVGTASMLIFVVGAVIVITGMFLISNRLNTKVSEIKIYDYDTSAVLLLEGIINSPECLLYTEDFNGKLSYTKDIIDWEKVTTCDYGSQVDFAEGKPLFCTSLFPENCPRKGPYVAQAIISDSSGNNVLINEKVPPGDGGLSFGQSYLANLVNKNSKP